MSIAGGLHLAFERATEVGCDAMQIFVKNQRQWAGKPITDEDLKAWEQARASCHIDPVIAHNTYLINLGTSDDALWNKSIDAMTDELERCEALSIPGLVAHPGAHVGAGEKQGLRRIAQALDTIHKRTRRFKTRILLETTAGTGSNLGHRLEQLAELIGRVQHPDRLSICLDTCHMFAAGYDLSDPDGFAAAMDGIEKHLGFDRIRAVHVNDSQQPRGSRKDRHAGIGQGELGRSAFRMLVNEPRLAHAPMILETPKGTDDKGRNLDRVNLGILRRMTRSRATRKPSSKRTCRPQRPAG